MVKKSHKRERINGLRSEQHARNHRPTLCACKQLTNKIVYWIYSREVSKVGLSVIIIIQHLLIIVEIGTVIKK